MLIFRALIDEFKDMSDEELTALLKPVKEGLENFSTMIREGNPELDHNDQKRILDLLYVINRKEKAKMFVDVELQSTKERFVEIRSTQYITAILAKTHFVENEWTKVIMIWINMAPAKHEEGTILVNPPLLYDRVHDVYCPREALKVCPTVILVNLYDIRKEREAEIRNEKTDIIAILSTIFSTTIDHKKKVAILKERGFTFNEKKQEMKDMESWSKGIFESMRDDIAEEVKREASEEGIRKFKKVYHLLAKGMSDEEILTAIPEVTYEFVKDARESYEEDLQLSKY